MPTNASVAEEQLLLAKQKALEEGRENDGSIWDGSNWVDWWKPTDEEIIDYTRAIGEVCKITGVQPSSGGTGFRSIANTGSDAIQEVPHFHTHIIGGRNLGRMISPA